MRDAHKTGFIDTKTKYRVNIVGRYLYHLKEIAFRKPFSKKLKKHILDTTFVELPMRPILSLVENSAYDDFSDLRSLFESGDDEYEFLGFENNIMGLFDSESDTDEFLGFENPNRSDTLTFIFQENTDVGDFLGF